MIDSAHFQGFSAFMAAMTAALGFVAPWPFIVTGSLFAIAGGYAGMFISPPQQRMSVWVTLFVALLIGLFAGMLHPHFGNMWEVVAWIADIPVQLVMGVAGLSSRWIAKRLVSGELPKFKTGGGDADA